jgi:hypothetical protein
VTPEPLVERQVELDSLLAEDEEQEEIIIQFGGAMFSASTGNRVWLNGRLLDEGELPDRFSLQRAGNGAGILRIQASGRQGRFELKAGQVLNLTTGVLFESYEYSPQQQSAKPDAAESAVEMSAAPESC